MSSFNSSVKIAILDAVELDEGALGIGYQAIDEGGQPECQQLGDQLGKGMDQADRAVIPRCLLFPSSAARSAAPH
jgi:hypothetical protein